MIGYKVGRNNSHCVLNLRMDGADDGTSFPDSSSFSHTLIRTNAVTKTATKKFGTASGYFDGASRLVHASAAEFNMSTEDFTIEFWVNCGSHTGMIVAKGDAASQTSKSTYQSYVRTTDPYVNFFLRQNSPPVVDSIPSQATSVSDNTWHHVVIIRTGVNMIIYADGIQVANETKAGILDVDNASQLNIGVRVNSSTYELYFTGYLDGVMLYKGISKYKRSFQTPKMAA